MDFSANHIGFVVACYAISAGLIFVMAVIIIMRARASDKQLIKLENRRKNRAGKNQQETPS